MGQSFRTHYGILRLEQISRSLTLHIDRVPQGSVQIELIFRLLLKITVDWPYNAINKFFEPERAHTNKQTNKKT